MVLRAFSGRQQMFQASSCTNTIYHPNFTYVLFPFLFNLFVESFLQLCSFYYLSNKNKNIKKMLFYTCDWLWSDIEHQHIWVEIIQQGVLFSKPQFEQYVDVALSYEIRKVLLFAWVACPSIERSSWSPMSPYALRFHPYH